MNPPFVNGRYIDQWETPINEWLVLAYGRDQIGNGAARASARTVTIAWAYTRNNIKEAIPNFKNQNRNAKKYLNSIKYSNFAFFNFSSPRFGYYTNNIIKSLNLI
jgi:hypothetical protein